MPKKKTPVKTITEQIQDLEQQRLATLKQVSVAEYAFNKVDKKLDTLKKQRYTQRRLDQEQAALEAKEE